MQNVEDQCFPHLVETESKTHKCDLKEKGKHIGKREVAHTNPPYVCVLSII